MSEKKKKSKIREEKLKIKERNYDVGVKRYFDPYDTRIVPHFMLPQS